MRVPRPASKLVDPNNAVLGKQKAIKVVISDESDVDDRVISGTDAATGDEMDVDSEMASSTYQQTKASFFHVLLLL